MPSAASSGRIGGVGFLLPINFYVTPKRVRLRSLSSPNFCHTLVPLAWVLSRLTGAALIFDPVISFYDEMVICQRSIPPDSFRAKYLRWIDSISFALADLVIWLTAVDEEHFRNLYHIPPERTTWLPPGVDDALFAPTPPPADDQHFVIHWDGSFIESHGVDVILDAANLLQNDSTIHFYLLGEVLHLKPCANARQN